MYSGFDHMQLTTTKELANTRVIWEKNGKRVGKVHHFIFHPSKRRVLGFTVKRPDAALMFKRKDMFVSLDGYFVDDDGQVVISDAPDATDRDACKALGVDYDACVIWVGMPVMTQSEQLLGYVDVVTFDAETGAVVKIATENGAANDAILGKHVIPAKYVKGFSLGKGVALAPLGGYNGESEDDSTPRGAIIVADEALDLAMEDGVAAKAGRATAIAADKAKKSTARVKAKVDKAVEQVKPSAKEAAAKAGEAVDKGTFAVGRQIGRATGMFAAFKEEYKKAVNEEDE